MTMKPYRVDAARDGDMFADLFWAPDQDAAEKIAFDMLCKAWDFDPADYPDGWEDLTGDLDGGEVCLDATLLYCQLADGLSDMIEEGRLTERAIPADYRWIVALLAKIATLDPGKPADMAAIRAHAADYEEGL